MSIKNYGQNGVGQDVQFGKKGNRLVSTAEGFDVVDPTGAPVRVSGAPAVLDDEFITKAQLATTSGAGFLIPLGDPTTGDGDGSLSGGAVPITPVTSVSNAIDSLNEILGKLVPTAPTSFPSGPISITTGLAGTNPLLASGAIPDNTNGGTIPVTVAGTSVSAYRGIAAAVSSNTLGDNGPGDSGTITAYINNIANGTLTFTTGVNSINSGGLLIADNKAYPPATPGFWESFDATLSNASALNGWNRYRISHSAAGTTNELYFLRDSVTATPTVVAGTATVSTPGAGIMSSGVTHLTNDAVITISNATINNLAGYSYTSSNPLTISNTSGTGEDQLISASTGVSYATAGIATPIPVNTTNATTVSNLLVTLSKTDAHGEGTLSIAGTNVNGTGSAVITAGGTILHMHGTTTRVNERIITAPGNNGVRVNLGAGANPGDTPAVALSGTAPAWDSSIDLSQAAYISEAAVVGGKLRRDTRNYATGFLPAGPNYSGKSATQYFDFSFAVAAKSIITVTITGTYSGLWVALPGVSDNASISPAALGGRWWNAFALYSGAGVPGRAGDAAAGCANGSVATGTSGSVSITFGTQSSTNATNNRIYIRLKLTGTNEITALSVA